MSKIARPTPFFLRVYRTARIGVHLLEGVATTTFVFPLLHLRTQRALVRLWSRRLLRMLNVETRLHGAVCTDGNVLIVSNHVSWLDVLVLSSVHPVRFIAKAELARVPLIERLCQQRLARRDLEHSPVGKSQRSKRSAPQATGIEHQDVGRKLEVERRPMAANDRRACAHAIVVREPWTIAAGRMARPAFFMQRHPAVGGAETHPRAGVDDDAKTIVPAQIVAPCSGLVAV